MFILYKSSYSNTSLGSAVFSAALVCNESYCNRSSLTVQEDNPIVLELKHKVKLCYIKWYMSHENQVLSIIIGAS